MLKITAVNGCCAWAVTLRKATIGLVEPTATYCYPTMRRCTKSAS